MLGLKRLPDVSTVSRSLSGADERSVGYVRAESTTVVLERLVAEGLASVTLDFDGSVVVCRFRSWDRDGFWPGYSGDGFPGKTEQCGNRR